MTTLFVTSPGTGLGKTFVCCRLLESLRDRQSREAMQPPRAAVRPAGASRVRCVKPVVTGFDPGAPEDTDTGRLLRAQGLAIDRDNIEATSPWRFPAPLSIDMAAAREGRTVPFDELVAFSRPPKDAWLNLIEGIGGVMAPIDDRRTVRDWIAALDAEVLLVAGSYLGSLSHTLTAVDVLARAGRKPLAIAISASEREPVPTAETAAAIERHCEGLPIVIVPRDSEAGIAAAIGSLGRLLAEEGV